MLDRTNDIIGLVLGVLALLGALLSYLRWVHPRIKKARATGRAAIDALLGRDAIRDSITGEEIHPALPGVGARMAHQEQQMELLTVTVTKLVDQQVHQQKLERRVDGLEHRVKGLEDQTIERVAGKAESVAAWRAVEAVAKQADPTTPEIQEPPS
ncbi:hypothetical protein F9L07_22580 [Pimelobacter simplex]|uniref:Uncharacterized protein n=1 Tax=Nocardioides simplex TaxID=2045 RepID=A0A7J5DT19_NOCSI|nr:hypothetical protein [Pimelobacter simplex]KAB2808304.1 hypothetical protein F9L07_22580 [Pimelobacter simplex]